MKKIVVGVDGSEESRSALEWALAEAEAHGASVVAVTAWHLPVGVAMEGAGWHPELFDERLEEEARQRLDAALRSVPDRPVEVTPVVQMGNAAQVLLAHAADADLLVVGARGHGGFTGLLLGSVSQQCATHATCPTVIIPRRR
jgi:nucleotide-binding universal stress UspA family protein